MTEPAFNPAGLPSFTAAYPEAVHKLQHNLTGHPLLQLPALVELATRLIPEHVEHNQGNLPIGIAPGDVAPPALSIADTIRSIEENGSWMALKFIENVPEYRQLLVDTLAEIAPAVQDKTGSMLKLEGFIFVSAPDAVTPFHFDPEHNILLQIRGNKVLTMFPADDDAIAQPEVHEAFAFGNHHRNLTWQDEFAQLGRPTPLTAGEALYIPVKMPHWVKNGPEVSVSLSVTWRSEWSVTESDARAFNATLRRKGIKPASTRRWPARNLAKAYGWRLLRKLGVAAHPPA
jgi:Cupin-like domain